MSNTNTNLNVNLTATPNQDLPGPTSTSPFKLYLGDCLDELKKLPDNSVDSIVTDPPYGLGFMGKSWDTFDNSQFGKAGEEGENDLKVKKNFNILPRYNTDGLYDFTKDWATECLRVLKPGGYILSFAGSRTYHKICMGIEDAGFEIRDQIMWVYGSGFPKSQNVGKAIDKRGGNPQLAGEIAKAIKQARESRGLTVTECDNKFCNGSTNWTWYEGRKTGCRPPSTEAFAVIVKEWPELADLASKVAEVERIVLGTQKQGKLAVAPGQDNDRSQIELDITTATTPTAKSWDGWGTALKPAHEPIVMARKPFKGTVAANVLEHGTGAINIDGCRVGTGTGETKTVEYPDITGDNYNQGKGDYSDRGKVTYEVEDKGRFPANFIHDGLTEEWSRYFYCPKASKKDRGLGNSHPTVKPQALMAYLCRLVTQPGGVILDPFMGSGTTGRAAIAEGFNFIGIEREAEYFDIASARIINTVFPNE